jgi:hypothetical protein
MSRLLQIPTALISLPILVSCSGKAEDEGVADYCGRLQQAVCNCEDGFGDDYEGDSCEDATARNAAAQQLNDNGDIEGYENAQSTCEVDYNALPDACTGEDGGEGEGEGEGEGSACPDEVPEQFRNIWDCAAASCPSGSIIYHYGVGASTEPPADGDSSGDPSQITVDEQWFIFSSSEWCTDTWAITGYQSPLDPATFDAPGAETVWEIEWTMTTGNQCSVGWGPLFFPESEEIDGPFSGFLEFDTHTELTEERNEDDALLVFSDVIQGGRRVHNPDYARGTAAGLNDEEFDGPPENYEWVGEIRAGCSRLTAAPGVPTLDQPLPPLDTVGSAGGVAP